MVFTTSQLILMFLVAVTLWLIIGKRWTGLSNFCHIRYSYVDFTFILLYFIEQIIFQYLINYTLIRIEIIFGIFSIIILTTASMQNRWSSCRIQKISDKSMKQRVMFTEIEKEAKTIADENEKLNEKLKASKKYIDELYKELKNLYKEFKKLKLKKSR